MGTAAAIGVIIILGANLLPTPAFAQITPGARSLTIEELTKLLATETSKDFE